MKTRPNDGTCDVLAGECVIAGLIVNYDELQAAAKRAKELAKGLSLTTSEEHSWYGEDYSVPVTDWSSVAILLDRIAS